MIKTHENLIYTTARWLFSWLLFSYWWKQTGFILVWCSLALPRSMCFLPMLMAELHSRLWGVLSKDCPFVAYLHCGDQGVQGSAKLYRGDHLTSWHIKLGYGTFFFPYAWNILQEGVNEHEEGSLATDDIRLFVTTNQPTFVLILFIPTFFCFISYCISVTDTTFFYFLLYLLLSLILLYGFFFF